MRVLDCGCGPGSISIDLATLVAPCEVVGIDIEPTQLDAARALAAGRQVENVQFQFGSIYDLPFPDASFDSVLAHTVVEHLANPQEAFTEVRRVVKPHGIFGVRDPDSSTWRMGPASPAVRDLAALLQRVQELNGGSPYYAPHQRELLLKAGFARAEGGASAMYGGKPEEMEVARLVMQEQFAETAFIDAASGCGYDVAALEHLLEGITAWSRRPDAFWALMTCHAIGWAT
jgi:SAM-dependent methyltransferase